MIVLTGATGTIGRDVVRELSERGAPIRVVTRNLEQARTLRGFEQAEIVQADADRPETLGPAFAGARQVLLITGADEHWHRQQMNLIEAARRAGAAHVTKVSVMGASPDEPSCTMRSHYAGEQALAASGMGYTILRPNIFLQNFVNFSLATIKSTGAFYSCTGDQPLAPVDTRDVAEIAVRSLAEEGHRGKLYELTGPEVLRYSEAAQRLSAAWQRRIQYVDIPSSAFAPAMVAVGVPAWLAEEIVKLYGQGFYGEGRGGRVTDTVQRLLGRPARALEDFARDYRALTDNGSSTTRSMS